MVNGHDNVVHVLLSDSQCLVDTKCQNGYTALHYSCRYGHVDIVRKLVKHKANVNAKTDSGDTPLTLAVRHEHDNVVHALLSDSQCLVDAKGQDGYTALHYSCKKGRISMMRKLVKHKADVNAKTDSGYTPLTLAAINKHDNVVHALSEYDCEVYAKKQDAFTALLHSSCERGYVGIVRILFKEDEVDNAGTNNVVHALLSDYQYLVDAKGQDGYTALHYSCRNGLVDIVRTLVKHKANVNARIDSGDTPLTLAAMHEHDNVVHVLLTDSHCQVNTKRRDGYTALHYSCRNGLVDIVRTLVKHKANVNARIDSGDTPLTLAAMHEHDNVVHVLLTDSHCQVNTKRRDGYTALHYSCRNGHVDIVRTLVKHKANVNARTDSGDDTPLTLAAMHEHDNVVYALLTDSHCQVNTKRRDGYTALHYSCRNGHVDIVRTLVKHKANVNARTNSGDTPLTLAAINKHDNVVHASSDYNCEVYAKDKDAYNALLHLSCERGYVGIVRILLNVHKVNVNARTDSGDTPLTLAAINKHDNVVHALSDYNCEVYAKNKDAYTSLLHLSCKRGYVGIVRTLLNVHRVNVNARTDSGDTPLTLAVRNKHDNVVQALSDYNCEVYAKYKEAYTSLLHLSCKRGDVGLVRSLITKDEVDINARTNSGDTPLLLAIEHGYHDVVHVLSSDNQCQMEAKGQDGYTALHYSCRYGNVCMVMTLIKHKANVNARTDSGDTPLTLAAIYKHDNVVHALSNCNCEVHTKDKDAYTALLYSSCERGYVDIVRTLVTEHKVDINAIKSSAIHVAALYGKLEVVIALIHEFNCDINVKGQFGRSLLHSACACSGSDGAVVEYVGRYLSPLLVDDNGNTPLHTACLKTSSEPILTTLLKYNPPLLVRNKDGKTPLDMTSKGILYQYLRENRDKVYFDYSNLETFAKKKYSSAEPITRIFVIGHPGAGKSSLVETLKREGFFESFRRVSESSVPLHTAGIVPSIHTSKHYGRSLFYDFAGDPEYYSSHAAILENLVSSKKGDNIFMIVVDLREESIKIREILYYWLLFIQHQNLSWKEPFLIIIGSHLDKVAREKVEDKKMVLQNFCGKIQPGHGVLHKVAHFILDCRNPKHQYIGDIQELIASFTKDSPRHTLSLYASTLLGLLEKDFSNEPAFSVAQLQSHIEVTHIALPREIQSLHSLLLELHDIGLLFIVNDSNKEHFHVVINISKLTNEVHRLLFSAEAKLRLKESCFESEGSNSSINIGITPRNVLESILPENIPKECLVQLQYCQLISHKDVGAFPSLTPSDSTDQSFLFFPALCSVDKSEVSRVTPPDLSYSIGWLARCTDPCDYFPPRFLHVLLLRVVFRFTLSVPAQNQTSGAFSPDHSHFQRRCTMWKTGVHWLMMEGVECMVELVNSNKRLVVITKSEEDMAENCINIFNRIISCVMEAKAEFCHSIKPQFFVLDCTDEVIDYLSEDHQFAMSEVEKALTHPEGKNWICSVSGKAKMNLSKLLCMRMFTHWGNLFPIDFNSILDSLANIVRDLYDLGRHLGISRGILDGSDVDFPTDTSRRRRELVRGWMSSTQDPPC